MAPNCMPEPSQSAFLSHPHLTDGTGRPRGPSLIDVLAHPYVKLVIINDLPHATRHALSLTSKKLHEAVNPFVYRHVRVTHRQFVNMVAVGTDSTKEKWVSGFSPALELALDCIKSLRITDYDSTSALPALPESRYEGVETLVIHATDAWVHWPDHIFPPALFPNANLFFHLPEEGQNSENEPLALARLIKHQLSATTNQATLLIPCTTAVTFTGWSPAGPTDTGLAAAKALTVIFLPSELPRPDTHSGWAKQFLNRYSLLTYHITKSTTAPLIIYGAEYYRETSDGRAWLGTQRRNGDLPPHTHHPFIEWLDSPQGKEAFSEEEREGLRLDDRDLLGQSRYWFKIMDD